MSKGTSTRLTPNFSTETTEAKRQWDDSKMLEKKTQSRILYPTKLSFKIYFKINFL